MTSLKEQNSPIKTEKKNCKMGTPRTGEAIFRNQFGDMGNIRKNKRKKNNSSAFSLTCQKTKKT